MAGVNYNNPPYPGFQHNDGPMESMKRSYDQSNPSGDFGGPQLPAKRSCGPTQQKNAISILNETHKNLTYHIEPGNGPVHAPTFNATLMLNGQLYTANAPSKKQAKLKVAEVALAQQEPYLAAQYQGGYHDDDFTSDTTFRFGSPGISPPDVFTPGYYGSDYQTPTNSGKQSGKNPVMILNELKPGTKYTEVGEEEEPGQGKLFIFGVEVDGDTFQGCGRSKKLAKARAAQAALTEIYGFSFDVDDDEIPVFIGVEDEWKMLRAKARQDLKAEKKSQGDAAQSGEPKAAAAPAVVKRPRCEPAPTNPWPQGTKNPICVLNELFTDCKYTFDRREILEGPEFEESQQKGEAPPVMHTCHLVVLSHYEFDAEAPNRKDCKVLAAKTAMRRLRETGVVRQRQLELEASRKRRMEKKREYIDVMHNVDDGRELEEQDDDSPQEAGPSSWAELASDQYHRPNQSEYSATSRDSRAELASNQYHRANQSENNTTSRNSAVPSHLNAVSMLNQEIRNLNYEVLSENWLLGRPHFVMRVSINGNTFEGSGGSKMQAKVVAAEKALDWLASGRGRRGGGRGGRGGRGQFKPLSSNFVPGSENNQLHTGSEFSSFSDVYGGGMGNNNPRGGPGYRGGRGTRGGRGRGGYNNNDFTDRGRGGRRGGRGDYSNSARGAYSSGDSNPYNSSQTNRMQQHFVYNSGNTGANNSIIDSSTYQPQHAQSSGYGTNMWTGASDGQSGFMTSSSVSNDGYGMAETGSSTNQLQQAQTEYYSAFYAAQAFFTDQQVKQQQQIPPTSF